MSAQAQNASDINLLEPSTFELPEDFNENPEDYELWSVRAPVKFDLSALNGTSFQFQFQHNKKTGPEPNVTSFEVDGHKYSLSQGHKAEISSFRILTAAAAAASQDEDEEVNANAMKPLPVAFHKHFNLIQTTNAHVTDVDLAPSNERAPALDTAKVQMRIPYTPIDQISGLKRRWNMLGANSKYTPPPVEDVPAPVETEAVKEDIKKAAHESSKKKSKTSEGSSKKERKSEKKAKKSKKSKQ